MPSASNPPTVLDTLAAFDGSNGSSPTGTLVADAAGNLFGTSQAGGTSSAGNVFEIARVNGVYGTPVTLASFAAPGGTNVGPINPYAGLLIDAAGNLFGTTPSGGTSNGGTVFEIALSNGVYGPPITLASLDASTGSAPYAALIADSAGDLFGAATSGGASGGGTVFELVKTGAGYSPLTVVASFNPSVASHPYGSLALDGFGDLFGTTYSGGTSGNGPGTVFEIANTNGTYGSPTTLVSFNGTNGDSPFGGVIVDAAGNVFGTTKQGGATGNGTVFEVSNGPTGYGPPTLTTLASFSGPDGAVPFAALAADASGNLFGSTAYGGADGHGTVFELAKTSTGFGPLTTLTSFPGATAGSEPRGTLLVDPSGDLFGTTALGGSSNNGTAFVLTAAPTLTLTSPPEASSQATQTITGTFRSGGSARVAGQSVAFTDNGVSIAPTTPVFVNGKGGFSATLTLPNPGPNKLVASSQDTYGNTAQSAPVLDQLLVPMVTITSPAEASNQATQTITGTVTTAGNATVNGEPVSFIDNGVAIAPSAPVFTDANGNFTAVVTLPNQGSNSLVAASQDSFGNNAQSTAVVDTLDNVAPTVVITSAAETGNQATQTITGTVSSGGSALVGGQPVTLTDNGAALATASPVVTDASGNFIAQVTLPNQGSNSLVASSQDSYGNQGQSAPVVDTLVAPVAAAQSISSLSVAFDPQVSFPARSIATLTGTASEPGGPGITKVELASGTTDLGPAKLNGDGTWVLTHDFGQGFYPKITATATDAAGASTTAAAPYQLDTGPHQSDAIALASNPGPNANLGQSSYFGPFGALVYTSTGLTLADGSTSYTYAGGKFFDNKPYASFVDIYAAGGAIETHVENNTDGSHTISGFADSLLFRSIGNDTFTGGGTSERFAFTPGFGADTITDFQPQGPGHDALDLSATHYTSALQVLHHTFDTAAGAVIQLNPHDAITLNGVSKADLERHPHHDFAFQR